MKLAGKLTKKLLENRRGPDPYKGKDANEEYQKKLKEAEAQLKDIQKGITQWKKEKGTWSHFGSAAKLLNDLTEIGDMLLKRGEYK